MDAKILTDALETARIGNRAVRKAQEEIRKAGLPLVFSHRGHLYYELPDGSITTEDPFVKGRSRD
ncbi:MAG: hypothetical protein NTX50_15320 [Candidatus Sumerlaeota bacterium]|nr:hypothetical protein [Candidatus Sumerlaeota bacterium]